jgi:hypothetical protein
MLWTSKRVLWLSVGLIELGEGLKKARNMISPTREALARVKLKALRCRVWFKALSRDERNLMELVIKVTERVRSFLLAKLLSQIVKKLLEAMGGVQAVIGEVAYRMKTDGLRLAHKLSQIAQGWGNKSAAKWPKDPCFVRYLTIMCLNDPA